MTKRLILLILLANTPGVGAFAQALVFGSSGNDALERIARATDGSVYAAGTFAGPMAAGGASLPNQGGKDFFLLKTTPGGALDWAVAAGSFLDEEAGGIAAHPQGGVLCAGAFWSAAQFGNLTLQSAQNPKALFLVRYNNNGQVQWGRVIDGAALKTAADLAVAPDGNFYLSGFFQGQLVFGTDTTLTAHGDTDFFLAKFTPAGQLIWALNAGDQGDTRGVALTVEPVSGDVIAAGFYNKKTRFGAHTLVANTADRDIFLVRFNAAGQALWLRRAGGVHDSNVSDLALDGNGHIYLAGSFVGVITLAENFSIQSLNGIPDFYLLRYAADGTPLLARSMGGALQEQATGIAVQGGKIALSGYFEGNLTIDGQSLSANTAQVRAFLATFDPELQLTHLEGLNSSSDALALGVTVLPDGQICAVGSFRSSLQVGNQSWPAVGAFDAFLTRLNLITSTQNPGKPEPEIRISPNPVHDTCTLQTPWADYQVLLLDAAGRLVFSGRNTKELFMGNYPSGTYTLFLRSREGRAIRKIIVP